MSDDIEREVALLQSDDRVRESENAPGTALPDRRRTIIHYITELATKDDFDFGATK